MMLDFNSIVAQLGNTLSQDATARRGAEEFIKSHEQNGGFIGLLFQVIGTDAIPNDIRIIAVITFKNIVKKFWVSVNDVPSPIPDTEKQLIRNGLVNMMLSSPAAIQRQLSDSITVIGKSDFPDLWPGLIDDLVNCLKDGNLSMGHLVGCLSTGHSIFQKYRHQFKSQALWTEIKIVLDKFCAPFTDVFVKTVNIFLASKDVACLSPLLLFVQIFYDLNVQDLPEFFEDNMDTWMIQLLALLSCPPLDPTNEDTQTPMEEMKSEICESVAMYVNKYGEEFNNHLGPFVQAVFNILQSTPDHERFDLMVSSGLKLLATVADRPQNMDLFKKPGVLQSLCQEVIVPNIRLRSCDVELFEDNPDEFIRRDMEGSDAETRRRAACDLVRSLSRSFEQEIPAIFGEYIHSLLATYNADPINKWPQKDAAIYLVISMAIKGATAKKGVTEKSDMVNVQEFYVSFIKPELEHHDVNSLPVLKACCIKYVVTFRNQLDTNVLIESFPHIIRLMEASMAVVHSYSANTLDKLMTLKGPNNLSVFTQQQVAPHMENLVRGCVNVLSQNQNEYCMRALVRTMFVMQQGLMPIVPHLLPLLTEQLVNACKNPQKPMFNHFLFEAVALLVRIVCDNVPEHVTTFETSLFPILEGILQTGMVEFMPYAFQMLAILLESRSPGQVTDNYCSLFGIFLTPDLWSSHANIAPMTRFLCAFIKLNCPKIVQMDRLNSLLGVFQKLINMRSHDQHGFAILKALILHCDPNHLSPSIQQIFTLLMRRLSSTTRTTKFDRGLTVFLLMFSFKFGPKPCVDVLEQVQPGVFPSIVNMLIVPTVPTLETQVDKSICCIGLSAMLFDYPDLNPACFDPLLKSIISLFVVSTDGDSVGPNGESIDPFGEGPAIGSEYEAKYNQLVFAIRKEENPFIHEVPDHRSYFVNFLQTNARKEGTQAFIHRMKQNLSSDESCFLVNMIGNV